MPFIVSREAINGTARASAWNHADLMVYNALLFAHYPAPVHTIIILLRPEAMHANLNGVLRYAPHP